MTESGAGIIIGVLGQWASGKTEAARTLVGHLGGGGEVEFLTDRVLFASQAVNHLLELEPPNVVVTIEDDGRQRLEGELATVWLGSGEDLRTVDPSTLLFDVHDDDTLIAWRRRAKVELGYQILERSKGGEPLVIEAAFGRNVDQGDESQYGRTISDFFARLDRAGVEPGQAKWIIVEAAYGTRSKRNEKRPDRIPVGYFERFGADGGDLSPNQQRKLEERGTMIKRVPNNHDDVGQFRADILAAFEDMFGGELPESADAG